MVELIVMALALTGTIMFGCRAGKLLTVEGKVIEWIGAVLCGVWMALIFLQTLLSRLALIVG